MNDKRIDDLLNEYSQSLGHSRQTIANAKVKPAKIAMWKPMLATCIGTVVITTFVLMPRRAEAATIDLVIDALKEANFWMATCRSKEQGGDWVTNYRRFHQGDKIRFESQVFGGAPRTYTTIIDSGLDYRDHSDLPYILKSKVAVYPRQEQDAMTDPLKNSLQLVGGMRSDFVRTDGITYQGSKAYSLKLNSKGRKIFELIVQKSTNLPLAVTVNNPGSAKVKPFKYRIDYSYVPPSNLSSLLKPDPTKYIVDQDADKASFADTWSKIQSSPDSPTIYNSSISPDGTIWITFGVIEGSKNCWTPLRILDKNYAQSSCFLMNSYGNSKDFRVLGYQVMTANYIPVDPSAPKPTMVIVEFGNKPAFSAEPKDMLRKTVTCQLTHEERDFPAHFPCFTEEVPLVFLASNQFRVRANVLKKRGDYLGAGKAFEKEHHVLEEAQYLHFNIPLNAAIACYEKLGMKAKVRELKALVKAEPKRPN